MECARKDVLGLRGHLWGIQLLNLKVGSEEGFLAAVKEGAAAKTVIRNDMTFIQRCVKVHHALNLGEVSTLGAIN